MKNVFFSTKTHAMFMVYQNSYIKVNWKRTKLLQWTATVSYIWLTRGTSLYV